MVIDLLPGDYIAGFTDGEGCFYLTYRKETKIHRKGSPIYFRWITYFAIVVRTDDLPILKGIEYTLRCGKISFTRIHDTARYNVQNIKDIVEKVIPFFEKYPLRAKKRQDFELWKEATQIVQRNLYNNKYRRSDNKRLVEIRNEMRKYKSRREEEYKNFP